MKPIVLSITTAALLSCIMALFRQVSDVAGLMFFLPFALGPLVVTWGLGWLCGSRISGWLLLASTARYSAWFGFIYLSAFHWHIDAQSAIALLFVGIYSLPVMLPLWILAFLKRKTKSIQA
ncbi:MAG: hypothetical protein EOP87_22560 [Verrucomicrobiaceae bacterium]|nr:MAG: hypothetical protein EOP87_22560 [Verrucomicrobiaceae bacterium]